MCLNARPIETARSENIEDVPESPAKLARPTGFGRFRQYQIEVPGRMRVPSKLLNSVAFITQVLGSDTSRDSLSFEGTGFFASIPSKSRHGNAYRVLVTAKHVAEALTNGTGEILVNRKGGGVMPLNVSLDRWCLHPSDRTVDMAVLPCNIQPEMDVLSISTDHFWVPGTVAEEEEKIGVGDEVFFPGLFTFAPGRQRNIPILRHGNLAMLPDEAIQVDSGFAEVYLIEARSIGGISGSPVFVRPTMALDEATLFEKGSQTLMGISSELKLLGLMRGHWDVSESDMNKPNYSATQKSGVNLGIGVVVPASKILETLNHPTILDMIARQERQVRKSVVPGND